MKLLFNTKKQEPIIVDPAFDYDDRNRKLSSIDVRFGIVTPLLLMHPVCLFSKHKLTQNISGKRDGMHKATLFLKL